MSMKWYRSAKRGAFFEPFAASVDKELFCSKLKIGNFFEFTKYMVVDGTRHLDRCEFEAFEKRIARKARSRGFVSSIMRKERETYEALEKFSEKVEREDLKQKNSEEIICLLQEYITKAAEAQQTFWVATCISEGFAKRIKEKLLRALRGLGKEDELEKYFSVITNPYGYLKTCAHAKETYEKEIRQAISEVKFLEKELKEINTISEITFLRTYRRGKERSGRDAMYSIVGEIGRRSRIIRSIQMMTYREIVELLSTEKKVPESKLRKRRKGFVLLFDKGREEVATGRRGRALAQETEQPFAENTTILKGMIACRGIVEGKIMVIQEGEFNKINKKDIIAITAVTPESSQMIRRCSGIIADEGGITCHAAILSREFKIPCIVGTKVATRILKNGERVILDAERGRVIRKSKQEAPG